MYVHIRTHLHMMCGCVYIYMLACIFTHTQAYIYEFTHKHVYINTCTYMHGYIHIHIHTNKQTHIPICRSKQSYLQIKTVLKCSTTQWSLNPKPLTLNPKP